MLLPDVVASLLARGVGRFEGHPLVEILPAPPGEHRVKVRDDGFAYHSSAGDVYRVPAGLVSDGASIPCALAPVLGSPLCSCNAYFGLVHDYLYRFGVVSKETADLLAFDMARCVGIDDHDALAIYEGLRLGGAAAWNQNASKRVDCGADRARMLEWV